MNQLCTSNEQHKHTLFYCILTTIQSDILWPYGELENLNVDEDVNRVWENIKENIKTSAKESLGLHEWKQHKPWFEKRMCRFLRSEEEG